MKTDRYQSYYYLVKNYLQNTNIIIDIVAIIIWMGVSSSDFHSLFWAIVLVTDVFSTNNIITAADTFATMSSGQNMIFIQNGSTAAVEMTGWLPRSLVGKFSMVGISTSNNFAMDSRHSPKSMFGCTLNVGYFKEERYYSSVIFFILTLVYVLFLPALAATIANEMINKDFILGLFWIEWLHYQAGRPL